jgi:phosphotriesterase-related protein
MVRRTAAATLALIAAIAVARTGDALAQRKPAPRIPSLAGRVLTVAGPIEPSALGQTLMHEHIFIDFKAPPPMAPPPTGITVINAPVAAPEPATEPSPRGRTGGRGGGGGGLTDYAESLAEIMEFRKIGGGTIVDTTNFGLTRDPDTLLRISRESGLHVVMGAGWYQKALHPPDMTERTVEELTDIVVRDVTVGAQGTAIRSGIIGEVGVNGRPLVENELKSVRASARAARLTGAPMTIHSFGTDAEMIQVLDIIASEGVDLSRVVMSHMASRSLDYLKQIAARGAYVEFDYLGQTAVDAERDERLVTNIANAINAGLADRVLVAHDVCTKPQLKKNGGGGYTYISDVVLPGLTRKGISDENIRKIMIDNPRRVLTFVAPQPLVSAVAATPRHAPDMALPSAVARLLDKSSSQYLRRSIQP